LLALFFHSSVHGSQVELLRCLSELKQIEEAQPMSHLFLVDGIAVGSVQSRLILANEVQTVVLPLPQVNGRAVRLRVTFPDADPRKRPVEIFVSYARSEIFGDRLIIFNKNIPPTGLGVSDFAETRPLNTKSSEISQFVGRLVNDELGIISRLHETGRLTGQDLLRGNLSLCRVVGRHSVINNLELVSMDRFRRAPAGF
jgi:hypothetical protein